MSSKRPSHQPRGLDRPARRDVRRASVFRRKLRGPTFGAIVVAVISAVAMGGSATFTPRSKTTVSPGTSVRFDLIVSTVELGGFATADIIVGANGADDLAFVYSLDWQAAFSNVTPVTPDIGFYDQDVFVGGNNGTSPDSVGTTMTVGTLTLSTVCMAPGVYTVQVDSKTDGGASSLTFQGQQETLNGSAVFTVACAVEDANCDGHVDLADHKSFLICLRSPGTAASSACRVFDIDGDGDVDVADHAAIAKSYTNCK